MFPQFQSALDELGALEQMLTVKGPSVELNQRSQKLAGQILDLRSNQLMLKPENAAEFRNFTTRLKTLLTKQASAVPERPQARAGIKKVVPLEGWLKLQGKSGISASRRYVKQTGDRLETLLCFHSEKDLLKVDYFTMHSGQIDLEEMNDEPRIDKNDPLRFTINLPNRSYFFTAESEADAIRWVNGLKEWRIRDLTIGDPDQSLMDLPSREQKQEQDAAIRILQLSNEFSHLAAFIDQKELKRDDEEKIQRKKEKELIAQKRQKERELREEERLIREAEANRLAGKEPTPVQVEAKGPKKKDGAFVEASKDFTVMSMHVMTLGLTAVAGIDKEKLFGGDEDGIEEPPKPPTGETKGDKALEVTKDIAMVSLHTMTLGLTAVVGIGKEDVFGAKKGQIVEIEEEENNSEWENKTIVELQTKEENLQEGLAEIEPLLLDKAEQVKKLKAEYEDLLAKSQQNLEFRNEFEDLYNWKEDEEQEMNILKETIESSKARLMLFQQQHIALTTQMKEREVALGKTASGVKSTKAEIQRLTALVEEKRLQSIGLKNQLKFFQATNSGTLDSLMQSIQSSIENEEDAFTGHQSQHKFLTKELHQLNEHYTHEQNILDTTLNVITEELEEKRDKFHRLRNRQCDISYPPSLILEHYGASSSNPEENCVDELEDLKERYFASLVLTYKLKIYKLQESPQSVALILSAGLRDFEDLYLKAKEANIHPNDWPTWLVNTMFAADEPEIEEIEKTSSLHLGKLAQTHKDAGALILSSQSTRSLAPAKSVRSLHRSHENTQELNPSQNEKSSSQNSPESPRGPRPVEKKKKKRVVRVAVIK